MTDIPADLIALKRARITATAVLKALPNDAPSEQRQQLRDAERDAFRALMDHPAYATTPWADLEAAARAEDPAGSD
jgi:hypothetical protein